MARLPVARGGTPLSVRQRPLHFSFFPVARGTRRYGLYDAVFAISPWSAIRAGLFQRLATSFRSEAFAFLDQAEDFYTSTTGRLASNPLLLYYSFLNLGKALVRARGYAGSLDRAAHGLVDQASGATQGLTGATLLVVDTAARVNVFRELVMRLGYAAVPIGTQYRVADLLPQVVVGHRLWREADRLNTERFVAISDVLLMHDEASRALWARLHVNRGDLARYGITRSRLMSESHLVGTFREVSSADLPEDVVCFEQIVPTNYTGRPSDVVSDVVAIVRPVVWRVATSVPQQGYRKYYLHMTPAGQAPSRLPQLASLWLLLFYLGSVVRYRPHTFDSIMSSEYGAFVAEFIEAQREQMLYLLASELLGREVAKPAII